jgi:hypothetical protein
MTNTSHLRVSAERCHPQGVLQVKGIEAQLSNIDAHHITLIGMIKIIKL